MAYGLEDEYLDPVLPGVLAPLHRFSFLADQHASDVNDILNQTSGIPESLTAADGETSPALDTFEQSGILEVAKQPAFEASILSLRNQDLGLNFPPGDAALDASGHSLGVLGSTIPPDASPGPGPAYPDAPPDVAGPDVPQ
jgi:hypothetical protein